MGRVYPGLFYLYKRPVLIEQRHIVLWGLHMRGLVSGYVVRGPFANALSAP